MPLYHPAVGLPPGLRLPRVACLLAPTRHARGEARKEGAELPPSLDTASAVLFEVATDDRGAVVRLGYRVAGGPGGRDWCLILAPGPGAWRLITAWTNASGDDHRTLDRGRYADPNPNPRRDT